MENKDYEIRWLIENEVALFIEYQEATVENVASMINATNQLISSSPRDKVPIIVNVSGMKGSPTNISAIAREFRGSRSEKWGFTIVIGAEGIVKFLAQIFFQLGRIEIRFASNMDEALQILYRIYPNLPRVSGE